MAILCSLRRRKCHNLVLSCSSLEGRGRPEAAARAVLVKMTPRKWLFIRTSEALLKVVCALLPAPPRPESAEAKAGSILVMEYWNLGDLVILVPFLRNLRNSFPKAHIVLLVNSSLQSFLQGQGFVDEFIPIRVPWAQHFSRWQKYNPFSSLWLPFVKAMWSLRQRKFDLAFSGRMDIRDNFLLWLSGARRRIGYGIGGGGFLLTDRIDPDLSRPHRTDVWLQLLNALGFEKPATAEQFHLSPESLIQARSLLADSGIPEGATVVGVHPGARIAIRRWGDERFAVVAKELLKPEDVHVLWFLEPNALDETPKLDRCHEVRLKFESFLAVLSLCRLLVCNDSGPMHLAGLLGVPVVAVFGSTNPVWFGPRGSNDRVVIRPEMWCRSCFDYCIFDQPYCLRAITPEQTIASVKEALTVIRDGSFTATTDKSRMAVASGERGNHG
jgi:ADP-heptose:LPS heptosyltransferase